MQDDNNNFKEYIKTLPPELRQAIFSVDYAQKLQEIVKNNKLMIDQAGKLEAETSLVMIGIEPIDKYVGNLVKNVGLSSIQASIVAHDVNESIFKNIRESLKVLSDTMEEEEVASEIITPISPVPTKETIVAGIENPENIKENEESISISSLRSNSGTPEIHESIDNGVEIRINTLPEIAPKAILPTVSSLVTKREEPFHLNIPPINNIVESKMTNAVIVPKETIIVPDKTKLPEKPKLVVDPYKEPII